MSPTHKAKLWWKIFLSAGAKAKSEVTCPEVNENELSPWVEGQAEESPLCLGT